MATSLRLSRPLASTLAILALAAGGTGTAQAEDENPSGFYLTASVGQVDVKVDNLDAAGDALKDLSADDAAWKVGFGWRLNPYIAFEGDYVDLGAPNGNFEASGDSGQYKIEMSGFSAYAIGSLPLGIFELSAKAGYYWNDVKLRVNFDNLGPNNGDVFNSDHNGEAWVYGVGAGVTFFEHLNTKIEYERMDIDHLSDTYVLWLTGAWRF